MFRYRTCYRCLMRLPIKCFPIIKSWLGIIKLRDSFCSGCKGCSDEEIRLAQMRQLDLVDKKLLTRCLSNILSAQSKELSNIKSKELQNEKNT